MDTNEVIKKQISENAVVLYMKGSPEARCVVFRQRLCKY